MTVMYTRGLGLTLGTPLFANLSFNLSKGNRCGLVAANGRGKSSLLRCLSGGLEPSSGDVIVSRNARISMVPQNVPKELLGKSVTDAVLSALPSEQANYESWRVDLVLDNLEVGLDLRARRLEELSGGWQKVALLARAWVTDPDLLLMDEPTNHLDLSRIYFLQDWLHTTAREATVVVASHDRAFLDAVTTHTLFLREDRSHCFSLPFSRAKAALADFDTAQARQYENDQRRADQLRRQAAKLKNIGVNSGSDLLVVKTKQLKQRAERIEEQSKPAYQERSAGAIRLATAYTHAKALVTLADAAILDPSGRLLFRTGKLWINRGDRVVVLGGNGAGKSQLIRAVHRAIAGEHLEIKVTPSVVLGYSNQDLSHLDGSVTPFELVTREFEIGDQRSIALLAGAGLGKELQETKICNLSGGQRSRVAMLTMRLRDSNFYLLDEPTNHLDIEGQESLEAELKKDFASCLLVSHDRTFIRSVGTRFWLIGGGRLTEVDNPTPFFETARGNASF